MKIIFASVLFLSLFISKGTGDVYICVSKTASKYHITATCKGLKECTHEIKKVTVTEAKKLGYKNLCGWEK